MTVDNVGQSGDVDSRGRDAGAPGVDQDELAVTLRVFAALESLPPDHPGRGAGAAGHRPALQDGQAAPARGAARRRSSPPTAPSPPPPPPARRAGSTTRPQGIPLASTAAGRERRARCCGPRACYICKTALHARSTRSTTSSARTARRCNRAKRGRPHRPDRAAGAAHRRPGQDRHVHRAAAAARRRAHHDHHPVPERRGAPLRRDARQRRLAAPAADRRHRPARPRPRSSRSPTRSPRRARWTS